MQPNNDMNNMSPLNNSTMGNFQNNGLNENKSSIGSIIGTIIVIAVIILGGLYFWGKRIDEAKMRQEQTLTETQDIQESNDSEINSILNVDSSDDLNSIEADLQSTDLDGLGAELEVELQ